MQGLNFKWSNSYYHPHVPVWLHLFDKAHRAVAHPHREPLGTRDKPGCSPQVPDPHIGPVTITSQTDNKTIQLKVLSQI